MPAWTSVFGTVADQHYQQDNNEYQQYTDADDACNAATTESLHNHKNDITATQFAS